LAYVPILVKRTEKILYEEENGKLPKDPYMKFLFAILNKLNMFPHVLGLANTAILNVKDNLYALYERDKPYLLRVNFDKKEIHTIGKIKIPFINYFSAHSKYSENAIETLDYSVIKNVVEYSKLTKNFELISKKYIKMKYIPIVHDFLKTDNSIIIVDSPLTFDVPNAFKKSLPVVLDKNKNSFIYVINKETLEVDEYDTQCSFYLFHYADYKENDNEIEVYASLYEELDFSELNISGKYRKLILNKNTKSVSIIKDNELETMDIEFPIKFENKIVFRSMENKRINGFVVCEGLKLIKKIRFYNKFISGEPAIHYVSNVPYLIAFAFNDQNNKENFLIVINMNTYHQIEIPISHEINIGFHSIFVRKID
jgi:hypothetical protein